MNVGPFSHEAAHFLCDKIEGNELLPYLFGAAIFLSHLYFYLELVSRELYDDRAKVHRHTRES